MKFWHMDEGDGLPAVTLCDEHALQGTNIAMEMVGEPGFKSMEEACVIFEATFAAAGKDDPAPITEHEGPCDQCAAEHVALEESA